MDAHAFQKCQCLGNQQIKSDHSKIDFQDLFMS